MSKIISFALLLFIGGLLLSFFYKKTFVDRHLVAIFVPAQHPAMDEIVAGFCDTLKERIPLVNFRVYNAQGNKTLMQSQAEMIVSSNPNLIFTIGNSTSQLIRTVLFKRNVKIPHVFTAVDDPVEKKLVYSLKNPGNYITGVITRSNFDQQIKYLLMIKPDIKSLLLAYDPTHPSNSADIVMLEKVLQSQNIKLLLCPINQTSEISQKVSQMIEDVDALLILKDHLLVMGVELLARLCAQRKIPLYASDFNSLEKGAALAYGILEEQYGIEGAILAHQILFEQQDPGLIPIKEIKNLDVKMNFDNASAQGVAITDEILTKLCPYFEKTKCIEYEQYAD